MREMHITDFLPAYALGCLETEEEQRVAEHLASCEFCQEELINYQELAGRIAASVEQIEPPERVKRALMERAIGEGRARELPEKRPAWWERWGRKLAPATAAIGLVLILILGVSNLFLWRQVRELRAAQNTELRTVALHGTDAMPSSTGVIILSLDGRWGTLVVDRLEPLNENQDYQLWLIRDGERDDGGVVIVNPEGYGWVYIHSPEPLASYTAFGVTIEPKGGSPGPTGEKVLGGDL
jgi:anti-sigma-K factor RskA